MTKVDGNLKLVTIRILDKQIKNIEELRQSGIYATKNEIIRHALNIGLDKMRQKENKNKVVGG